MALLVVCLVCVCFQMITGVFGYGRSGGERGDFNYMYAAGVCWSAGDNPYVYESLEAHNPGRDALISGFAYPPHTSLPFMGLAAMPFHTSRAVFTALNVIALIGLSFSAFLLTLCPLELRPYSIPFLWVPIAAILASPFASHVIWLGQTSLISAAFIVFAWICASRGRPTLAGVLMAIAAIKPQLALLPILWLCVSTGWRFIASIVATGAIMAAGAAIVTGPITAIKTWLLAITHYQNAVYNQLGFRHTTSLQSTLEGAGLHGMPNLLPIAVLLTFLLWRARSRVCRTDYLPLLLLIGFCFIPAHDYDFVALAPVFLVLWKHASRTQLRSIVVCVYGLMYLPQRFISLAGVPALAHWRMVVLMLVLIWLASMSVQARIAAGQRSAEVPV